MPSADFSAEGCIFSSFGSGSDAKARPDRKRVTDSTEVNPVVQRQSCPISDCTAEILRHMIYGEPPLSMVTEAAKG